MRLRARVSACEARQRLSRPRWRWARAPTVAGQELVWLPAAVAEVAGSAASGERSRKGSCLCVVERVLGHAWLVAGPDDPGLEAGRPAAGDEDAISPRLAVAECAARAAACLGRSLALARERASAPGVPQCREASYPFWVLYLRRRRRIDLRILDAVTGRPASSGIRAALVTAFLDAARDARSASCGSIDRTVDQPALTTHDSRSTTSGSGRTTHASRLTTDD